jgi:hypothetical protein
MNNEEQVPQARTPGVPAGAAETPVEQLEGLGVHGILWQLARDGQLIDVRCEMPQCYCFRGRRYFEPKSPLTDWSPTADHYPRLKMHGGHLTPATSGSVIGSATRVTSSGGRRSTRCSGSGCL